MWPEKVWPAPKRSAAPGAALAGATVAGLVAALALRLDVPGIGFLFTGVAMLAASLGTAQRRITPVQATAAAATCALLAVGTLRAAEWLFALCVLVATLTGALALVGGRTWPGLMLGSLSMPLVQVRAVAWAARGVARLGSARGAAIGRATVVGIVSICLLGLFGGLFYGADGVFAGFVDASLPSFALTNVIGNSLLFALVAGLTLSAACLAHLPPRFDELTAGERVPLRRWEWAVPLALLNVLFAGFVAIQLTILFGQPQEAPIPAGLTFAEYARQGFWQLLAVTVLTLLVIAVANAKAGRDTRADRALVRLLLGGLSAFTLVIVASAVFRMASYEEEYGFTRLRLFVHTVELWLGLVFVLVLVAGVRLRGRWLPRAIVGTGVAALLGLAILNPDAYVAERNIERFHDRGKIDVQYLGRLSADAVPALDGLEEPQRSCTLRLHRLLNSSEERWYTFNVARNEARAALEARPADDAVVCR